MTACLNDDGALDPEHLMQSGQALLRSILGRVRAIGAYGNVAAGPNTWQWASQAMAGAT